MLAYIAIAALFAAAEPSNEQFEHLETQEEILFYEEDNEEIALNDESEYEDLVFFEEPSEFTEDFLFNEEE